jgi:hypothetical protein
MHRQIEIALAAPMFDPRRQISSKFFWMPERLISAMGWVSFFGD